VATAIHWLFGWDGYDDVDAGSLWAGQHGCGCGAELEGQIVQDALGEARGSRVDTFKVFFLLMSIIAFGWAVFFLAGASDARITFYNDDPVATWLMSVFGIESRRAIMAIVFLVLSFFSVWAGVLFNAPARADEDDVTTAHDKHDNLFLMVLINLFLFVAFPAIVIMEYPLEDTRVNQPIVEPAGDRSFKEFDTRAATA